MLFSFNSSPMLRSVEGGIVKTVSFGLPMSA